MCFTGLGLQFCILTEHLCLRNLNNLFLPYKGVYQYLPVCVCMFVCVMHISSWEWKKKKEHSKRISSKPRAISPLGEYCLTDSCGGLVFPVYLSRDYPVKPRELSQPPSSLRRTALWDEEDLLKWRPPLSLFHSSFYKCAHTGGCLMLLV